MILDFLLIIALPAGTAIFIYSKKREIKYMIADLKRIQSEKEIPDENTLLEKMDNILRRYNG